MGDGSLPPEVHYARSGETSIAYQLVGDGPRNLVHVPGFVSHLDLQWEQPLYVRFMRRLASFARVAVFDKRGTGLSDPVPTAPSTDERMDDIAAVMDDAGIDTAVLLGVSEGASLAALFAATYPQRVEALVLYGGSPRLLAAPDYPWGMAPDEMEEFIEDLVARWGTAVTLEVVAPSRAADQPLREWWARFEQSAASPGVIRASMALNARLDVREILPAVQAPTLVMHTRDDMLPIEGARLMAERIPGAKLVEWEGSDHWPWAVDPDRVCAEIEEFVTGARPTPPSDRVLATVAFTDIVDSTRRAGELGDARWRELLDAHDRAVRTELRHYGGREIKTTGDGFLLSFDRPAHAIECLLRIADAVRRLGIEVRAGAHTGEVELRGDDIGGIAVHTAARVSALSGPGEVLVSSTVKDLVAGSDLGFDHRGTHELKGVDGSWDIYAAAPGTSRAGLAGLPM